MPRKVPARNSSCSGTTVPTGPARVILFRMAWLPRMRSTLNPNRLQRILTHAWPERVLRGGRAVHLEGRDDGGTGAQERKLLEVQFGRFLEVRQRLLDAAALAGGPD